MNDTVQRSPARILGESRRDRLLTLVMLALGASPWTACSSSEDDGGAHGMLRDGGTGGGDSGGSGGGGAGGATVDSAAGGGGSGGGTADAASGGGPADSSARPALGACTSPAPRSGGWIACAEGFDHRPTAGRCTVDPADGAVPFIACNGSPGCPDTTFPKCVELGAFVAPDCRYACEVDADCPSGMACYCGGSYGYCVEASCKADSDCAPSAFCGTYRTLDSCSTLVTGARCQKEADDCVGDADCLARSAGSLCGFDPTSDHRVCGNGLGGCGRPFLVDGRARSADTVDRCDWLAEGVVPARVAWLSVEDRAACAEHFCRMAELEHASVAAFARFALELLALGAPSSLLAACGDALQDERRHAELCFSMASAYAGRPLGPSRLRVDGCLDQPSLRAVVLNTVLEGCIGELVAAAEATLVAEHAEDPVVRSLMQRIAEDESRHAELAWRFVRWAVGEDPSLARDVTTLVAEESRAARAVSVGADDEREVARLLRLGVTPAGVRAALRQELLTDVVAAGARALAPSAPMAA